MSWKSWVLFAASVPVAASAAQPFPVEKITADVSVMHGPVNGVLIQRNGEILVVYGDPRPEPAKARQVLFTHHRRDVVWAGRRLVERGAEAVAPEAEKALFTDVGQFWEHYRTARFHDYAHQSSRILAEPIPLAKTVRGGDTIDWQGLTIRVVEIPGYTRGAVSYLIEIDGKRIACVGDLIYGHGQFLDLFSLQDAIPQVLEDCGSRKFQVGEDGYPSPIYPGIGLRERRASTRRRAIDWLLQDQFDSHLSPLRTGMGSKVQAARRSYR